MGKEACEYPWLGMTRALSESGLPFWPVHADDLEKYADRLNLLILPNVCDSHSRTGTDGTGLAEAGQRTDFVRRYFAL